MFSARKAKAAPPRQQSVAPQVETSTSLDDSNESPRRRGDVALCWAAAALESNFNDEREALRRLLTESASGAEASAAATAAGDQARAERNRAAVHAARGPRAQRS